MKKFRFQFSLRTLFIFSFICAIICALVKCERDARNNYESALKIVAQKSVDAETETKMEIYKSWQEEAKTNPTFPIFLQTNPTISDQIQEIFLINAGPSDSFSKGYFSGTDCMWNFRTSILPPHTDFSHTPWDNDPLDAINLSIIVHRPCSIISRDTSISIEVHKAPQNQTLLDRLKPELDKAGLKYDIREN